MKKPPLSERVESLYWTLVTGNYQIHTKDATLLVAILGYLYPDLEKRRKKLEGQREPPAFHGKKAADKIVLGLVVVMAIFLGLLVFLWMVTL